eukprot:gene9132-1221_t
MPTGKGFVDKDALNYILSLISSNESTEAKLLREETKKHKCAQMISDLESAEILKWLIKLTNCKKTLDIGVFTGYSSLIMAQSLPKDGEVYAVERKKEFVEIGIPFWKKAKIEDKIQLILGDALETLEKLSNDEKEIGTFDCAFIDADKKRHELYFELCLKLVRKGGLICIDNVLFFGRVWDENDNDKITPYIREFNEKLLKDKRVEIVMLPISDGMTICRIV